MLSRDPETVRLAELRMKKILDEKSMIEGAKEEGKEEGKEEVAINLLKLGMSEDIVSQGTGLSIDKIREIKLKLKNT
jgi:predicted transposase/invertase (TIGR01784 family)